MANRHCWCHLDLQLRHAHCCLTPHQRDLLAVVSEKIKAPVGSSFTNYWAKQAAWNQYGSTASIITRSTYAGAEDFVRCGYASFRCHDRLLCPLCCYSKLAGPVIDEFGDRFTADAGVYYIVLSLSSNPEETQRLIFKDVGEDEFRDLRHRDAVADGSLIPDYGLPFQTDDDLRDVRILSNFYADAIKEVTDGGRGIFSGAVGGPELAVRFGPLRVLPHANYICWSPGLSIDDVRELRRFIREKMRNCRSLQTKLLPSVACYRLRTPDDLRRVIGYILKPIDLAVAYTSAAERVSYSPAALAQLNLDINTFLKNLLDVFWCLHRVARYGRCNAAHRQYFGHVTERRLAQRARNAERRAAARPGKTSATHDVSRWEQHHQDQIDRPVRPRWSRFSHWHERYERPPHHPASWSQLNCNR